MEAPQGCNPWPTAPAARLGLGPLRTYVPPCSHHTPMALAPLIIRWGPDIGQHVAPVRSLQRVRPQGCDAQASRLEGWRDRMGAVSGGDAMKIIQCERCDSSGWVC